MDTLNITKETELRHLPTKHQLQLAKLLDVDESVLSLIMGNIVKDLDNSESQLRFNSTDIDSLREHSVRHNKSSIFVLLEEWSSMGKSRPKMKHLLELLVKCQLFQAADFVADLINENHAVRPTFGPAAKVNISLENENIENIVNGFNYPFTSINLTKINRINYEKPEFHTPDMKFVNQISLNTNNHPTAIFGVRQDQNQQSDLIKFSKTFETQIPKVIKDSENTTNSNSMAIPMTVNSNEDIPVDETNFIPLISGLMLNGSDSEVVQSKTESNQQSHVPNLSGLMNTNTYESEHQFSSSEDQSQSMMTQSSTESTVSHM